MLFFPRGQKTTLPHPYTIVVASFVNGLRSSSTSVSVTTLHDDRLVTGFFDGDFNDNRKEELRVIKFVFGNSSPHMKVLNVSRKLIPLEDLGFWFALLCSESINQYVLIFPLPYGQRNTN